MVANITSVNGTKQYLLVMQVITHPQNEMRTKTPHRIKPVAIIRSVELKSESKLGMYVSTSVPESSTDMNAIPKPQRANKNEKAQTALP